MTELPKGEKLRRAIRWISDQRQQDPERGIGALVNDASVRFDLSPKESEFLVGFYREARPQEAGSG